MTYSCLFREWPVPVTLKEIDEGDSSPKAWSDMVWDPRRKLPDRYHLMPIITPSYPQQNSTYNVTLSTLGIIMRELRRGV
jgi:poly(A) polymerase